MLRWFEWVNNAAYTLTATLLGVWVWLVTVELFQNAGQAGGYWIVALLLGPFICTLFHELGHGFHLLNAAGAAGDEHT